jgi:hypothetical protein
VNEKECKKMVTKAVNEAKAKGLVLDDEERWALWRLGSVLPVDAFLGEEPNDR